MRNLSEVIRKRTAELNNNSSSKFNTNDFLLEILLNKKIDRSEVINKIIEERIRRSEKDFEKMSDKEFNSEVDKLFKTSKNGLDTSVSDSNNNSSFSYNERYSDYELIKKGSTLEIIKRK